MYKIEELEKMVKGACEKNDYNLYKEACSLLDLRIKLGSQSEADIACFVLYEALSNEKSQGFLNTASEIVNGYEDSSYADVLIYGLLLSVRADSDFVTYYLLNICDDIQGEILKMIGDEVKSEKRE